MDEISFKNKRLFIKDVFVMVAIVILPFLFYSHEIIPAEQIWKTDLFEIDFDYFKDANYFFWYFNSQLLIIVLLFIWYITSYDWWSFLILIPILGAWFKLLGMLSDEFNWFKFTNIFNSLLDHLPVLISIIFASVLINIKVNFFNFSKIIRDNSLYENKLLMNKMSKISRNYSSEINDSFNDLKKRKEEIKKENYINELVNLRDRLIGG